jgi:hypothetical protein
MESKMSARYRRRTRAIRLAPTSQRRRHVLLLVLGLTVPTALTAACGATVGGAGDTAGSGSGDVARIRPSTRPAIEAAFPRESYRPGAAARLRVYSRARGVTLQVFRAGTEPGRIAARDELRGSPVGPPRRLGTVRPGQVIWVRMQRRWESGFYFARLTGAGGKVGYAPFVVRPRRLGGHRVAVVLPTLTWQAYNFRDDDGDRDEDTWYADPAREHAVRIGRPYENRGVPPHYKHYDQPFLRWLFHTARAADYLAQADLEATNGRTLARAYDLIVFPGHHEYVTQREYDAVERFRDLGGGLMFLSANNFYWRVDRRGDRIIRIRHWRDLGRPEAALVGVQYVDNDDGRRRGPWIVRSRLAAPWLFSGLALRRGDPFSSGGIEVDMLAPSSPRGTRLIAEIPNLLGPGVSAQMTYYETASGARVFAAGAFTLAGSVWQPDVSRLLENLWARLAREG